VLQALFNILGDGKGRTFLDLFAGTGRAGREAARRGFSQVVFVEISAKSAGEIGKLIRGSGHDLLRMDARRALQLLVQRPERFDVIFADPPYCSGWVERIGALSGRLSAIMKEGGVFILEHSKRELICPSLWNGWEVYSRPYGETILSCFRILPHERVIGDDQGDVPRVI
jgi:16S rRNA (guanine(966)-N(2))-methyltransferase RsmD